MCDRSGIMLRDPPPQPPCHWPVDGSGDTSKGGQVGSNSRMGQRVTECVLQQKREPREVKQGRGATSGGRHVQANTRRAKSSGSGQQHGEGVVMYGRGVPWPAAPLAETPTAPRRPSRGPRRGVPHRRPRSPAAQRINRAPSKLLQLNSTQHSVRHPNDLAGF